MLTIHDILHGFVDGSRPLPPPHPQRLSFPKDRKTIDTVASVIEEFLYRTRMSVLSDDDLPHVVFKLASWCSRKGTTFRRHDIEEILSDISVAVDVTLVRNPAWAKSRSGVGWAVRRFNQWQCEADKAARRGYEKPPRVAELDFIHGYYLVELTTAAHVHQEGEALNHCMSWSINLEVLKRRGHILDALTYAVKIRTGELRIFSVRNNQDKAILTITYAPHHQKVMRVESEHQASKWSPLRCSAVRAIATVVPLKRINLEFACEQSCPARMWCINELEQQHNHIC